MTTLYKNQLDIAGYNGFGLQFSDQKYSASLAITTDTTLTVPITSVMGAPLNSKQKFLAVINVEANLSVWCAVNTTATVPGGASFAATNSDLIIGGQDYARVVSGGDILHFLAPTAGTDIVVMFYALQAT